MSMYEVTYTCNDVVESELIEASAPTEATRLFYQKYPNSGRLILCVVWQDRTAGEQPD